ncbi:MAG: FAD-dependent oxidoreductase, partial [Chloroflexota bacterium]
ADGVLGLRHEPHVAADVFDRMLDEAGISVETGSRMASVEMDGTVVRAMVLHDGTRIEGARFIDATYEGDLLAAAGIPYRIGREASDEYGESLGVDVADDKVQAYTYRLCVTDRADNRIPIESPDTYDRAAFVPVLDHLGDDLESVVSRVEIPGGKWDLNNRDPFSTDAVGLGWGWAMASADERAEIADEHRDHVAGFLAFLATDRAVPEPIRREASALGLCADEWEANGAWPPQLYVREARRMVGDYVLSQWDLENDPIKSEPIALGTYRVDSHAVDRVDGQLEGVLNLRIGPYAIPYRSIIPRGTDATNLLVPVALSATHVAFSSLRMEPTWMATGEAAGVAAAMDAGSVQEVSRAMLDERLRERGAMLDPPAP